MAYDDDDDDDGNDENATRTPGCIFLFWEAESKGRPSTTTTTIIIIMHNEERESEKGMGGRESEDGRARPQGFTLLPFAPSLIHPSILPYIRPPYPVVCPPGKGLSYHIVSYSITLIHTILDVDNR